MPNLIGRKRRMLQRHSKADTLDGLHRKIQTTQNKKRAGSQKTQHTCPRMSGAAASGLCPPTLDRMPLSSLLIVSLPWPSGAPLASTSASGGTLHRRHRSVLCSLTVPIVLSQLLNLAVHRWPIRSPRMTRRTKMCAHGLPVQCSYPYMWRLRHMALKALRCMFLFAGLDDGSPVLGSAFGRWQERSVRRRRLAGKAMGGVQLFLPATRGLHSPLDTCLSNATALGNCQIVD